MSVYVARSSGGELEVEQVKGCCNRPSVCRGGGFEIVGICVSECMCV